MCGESDGQYKTEASEGSVVSSAAQLSAEAPSRVSEEKLARHPLMCMRSSLPGEMEAASWRELSNVNLWHNYSPDLLAMPGMGKGLP